MKAFFLLMGFVCSVSGFMKPVDINEVSSDIDAVHGSSRRHMLDIDHTTPTLTHCSVFEEAQYPIIYIALRSFYTIKSFELWLWNDTSNSRERDRNFEIRVGEGAGEMDLCYKYNGTAPIHSKHECENPICGQFISIQRQTDHLLETRFCGFRAYSGLCVYARFEYLYYVLFLQMNLDVFHKILNP